MIDLPSLLTAFVALGLGAAFIAPLINVLKSLNILKDGDATRASLYGNLGLFVLFILGTDLKLDVQSGVNLLTSLGTVFTALIPLLTQPAITNIIHQLLKMLNIPVIGKSFSK